MWCLLDELFACFNLNFSIRATTCVFVVYLLCMVIQLNYLNDRRNGVQLFEMYEGRLKELRKYLLENVVENKKIAPTINQDQYEDA